jgi:hypothetical protein
MHHFDAEAGETLFQKISSEPPQAIPSRKGLSSISSFTHMDKKVSDAL